MTIAVPLVASVFSFIYYVFGLKATWISLFFYLCLPFILAHDKVICYALFMNKLRRPFSNLRSVKDYGVNAGRYLKIKFESRIDNREIEIALWHILPRSSVDKWKCLSGNPEEMDKFFDDQLKNSQRAIVIYSHGIISTIAEPCRVELYKILQRMDMHVVAYDYRGFGDSTPVKPTRMGLVEDMLSVYAWVKNLSGDSPVFLWSHSIGTGITLKAVSRLEEYSSTLLNLEKPLPYPKGIMLESPFSRLADGIEHFKYIDFILIIPFVKKFLRHIFATNPDVRLDSLKYVGYIKNVPLLVMHARDDDITPFQLGLNLYKAAKYSRTDKDAQTVKFIEFSTGRHIWLCREKKLPVNVSEFVNLYKKS